MRISENMRSLRALRNTTDAASRFDEAARVASSGRRVENPSDDPTAYAAASSHASRVKQLATRAQNLENVSSELEIAESALASAGEAIVRAREIATQMANGDLNAADRATAANEIRALKETLVGAANARGAHGYLFGGTRSDVAPFDTNGVFSGNTTTARIEVGDGIVGEAGVVGAEAFTTAGIHSRDAFAELDALATALGANDLTTIRGSLDVLDEVHAQIIQTRSDAGAKIERFRAAAVFAESTELVVSKAKAELVEADAVDAYSKLAEAKAAYERSLEVTQKILSLSSFQRG